MPVAYDRLFYKGYYSPFIIFKGMYSKGEPLRHKAMHVPLTEWLTTRFLFLALNKVCWKS